MDNDAFRKTYHEINERFCPFEKTILASQCTCSRAARFLMAEREGVNCKSDISQQQCLDFLDLLRRQSRFILKSSDARSALPHAQAMRLQVGGLRGLCCIIDPDSPVPEKIENVTGIVEAAVSRFGGLDRLPFQEIIKQIAAYKGRDHSNKKE